MKNVRTLRKRRAVSPVIATVILVAVTITVAVAVSYWMSGIASQYTGFEKVEIQSAYAQKSGDTSTAGPMGWRITLQLQNTGTGEATLSDCFINDIPYAQYGDYIIWSYDDGTTSLPMPSEGLTLASGEMQILYVDIEQGTIAEATYYWTPSDITFTSGTTINVKIHSAAGMDYIRLVRLP